MTRVQSTTDSRLAERARAMRAEGATYAEIKESLGIGSSTVSRLLGRYGRGRPRARISNDVRRRARRLRLDGFTIPQIADEIGVARSTAWLIVHDIEPSAGFDARQRRAAAGRAYWLQQRPRRLADRQSEIDSGSSRVGDVSDRELLLIGTVAYWAEGTESKPWHAQDRLTFTNSDPDMIRLFLAWLRQLGVTSDRIKYRVSVHVAADVDAAVRYWADIVGATVDSFQKTTLKRHSPRTTRRNTGHEYHGCLVVRVSRSASEYRLAEGLWKGLSSALERR